MSLKIQSTDSFLSTRKMMGGASIVPSIAWADIMKNALQSEPIFDARGKIIPERQNIVGNGGRSLAIHQGRFSLTQPAAFRDMVQESIGDIPHKVSFAATFNDSRSYVIGVSFGGAIQGFTLGNNDKHEYFHLFGYSIDGSTSKWTSGLIERLFCSNQFAAIARNATGKAKNTENGDAKFATILSQLSQIERFQADYRATCERMANEKLSADKAKDFVAGLLVKGKEVSTQAERLIEDVTMRFSRGIETHGETRLDLFHAFTERFTHEASRKTDSTLGASIIGSAADVKRDAFNLLDPIHADQFAKVVSRGHSLLALPA